MISLQTKNEIVAKRKLKDLGGGDQDILIDDVYETFKKNIAQEGLNSKTSTKYLQHLDIFIGFISKTVYKVKDIKKEHLLDFLAYLAKPGVLTEDGATISTISGYKRTLKKLFIMFEQEDALIKNPMRWIKVGRMENTIKFFKQDEIRRILAAVAGNDYEMALVLYFLQTGLRIQGVVDSSWEKNVNLDRQSLKIKVKRKKEIIIRIPTLSFGAICRIKKRDKIFDTNRQKTIYESVKKILEKAGVEGSPHDFRDTYATYSLHIGVPLPVVRDRLGHSSIATTDKYSHAINFRVDNDIKELFNDWEIRN